MNISLRQQGFTLIEILVVFVGLSLISIAAIPYFQEQGIQRTVNQAAVRVQDVTTAARRYRVDTGAWPSTVNNLRPAYLTATQASAPLGGSYSFSTSASGDFFEIRFSASNSVYARRLLGRLPYSRRVGPNDVVTGVGLPGWEPSFDGIRADMDDLYPRDGSRPLTAALAGGDQDALDLNNVEANLYVDREDTNYFMKPSGVSEMLRINAQHVEADEVVAGRARADALQMTRTRTAGTQCNPSTGNIGLSATGIILTCMGNTWQAAESSTYRSYGPSTIHSNTMGHGLGTSFGSLTLNASARDATAYVIRSTCSNSGATYVIRAAVSTRSRYSGMRTVFQTWWHDSGRGGGSDGLFIIPNDNAPTTTLWGRWQGGCDQGGNISLVGYFT